MGSHSNKGVLLTSALFATLWGCSDGATPPQFDRATVTNLNVFQALNRCINGCVDQHCAAVEGEERVVLAVNGELEAIFQAGQPPDEATNELCSEKANQAIAAQDYLASLIDRALRSLQDLGPPPTPGDELEMRMRRWPFVLQRQNPGDGYFWATAFLNCKSKCLDQFMITVVEQEQEQ